jgi:hypothetical protein
MCSLMTVIVLTQEESSHNTGYHLMILSYKAMVYISYHTRVINNPRTDRECHWRKTRQEKMLLLHDYISRGVN